MAAGQRGLARPRNPSATLGRPFLGGPPWTASTAKSLDAARRWAGAGTPLLPWSASPRTWGSAPVRPAPGWPCGHGLVQGLRFRQLPEDDPPSPAWPPVNLPVPPPGGVLRRRRRRPGAFGPALQRNSGTGHRASARRRGPGGTGRPHAAGQLALRTIAISSPAPPPSRYRQPRRQPGLGRLQRLLTVHVLAWRLLLIGAGQISRFPWPPWPRPWLPRC